ncbi:hypothetical protein IMT85_004305 [Salmonella enterica]|nr:hypothetical protein [Salmonella enterica]
MTEKAHPEQAYRLCLGLLSLTREYPTERVNSSCRLANSEGLTRLKVSDEMVFPLLHGSLQLRHDG